MNSSKRKDALLNEYKGSLFEFLVAKELAANFKQETEFLKSISDSFYALLTQQEDYLRNSFPLYTKELPVLAKKTVREIIKDLKIKDVDKVELVGRLMSHEAQLNDETDILLHQAGKSLKISLKISKKGSFTNTKSAGVRSFFSKYFLLFDSDLQQSFNKYYDLEYTNMAISMYQELGLEYTNNFEGWEQNDLPVLPGDLDEKLRVYLKDFYAKINTYLFEQLQNQLNINKESFYQSILPLLGFTNSDIYQVTAFYDGQDSLKLHGIKILNLVRTLGEGEVILLEKNTNTIEVTFLNLSLQIRLKPMNKFIHHSYKLNCAVKIS